LAGELACLYVVGAVSHETVRRALNKRPQAEVEQAVVPGADR
jgi:hypothetical protein